MPTFSGTGLILASTASVFALLSGCATTECPPCKEAAKPAVVQIIKPLRAANWNDLPGWASDQTLSEATPALLQSCSALGKKAGWQEACSAFKNLSDADRKNPATLRAYYQK